MIKINQLSNGIFVVLDEIEYVRSIAFGIFVGCGTRNECFKNNGMSHFIEHMMFKGTKNRSAKDIAEEMDAVGGQINAFTTKEYTCYHTRVLDRHFDRALDVLSDMYLNSSFDQEEIQKEANVIQEEINMYEDDPEDLVHESLQSAIWGNGSLSMPILGTKETLKNIDQDSMFAYYKKNYQPQNTIISVSGNFKEKEMMEKLEKTFAFWKASAVYEKEDHLNWYQPAFIHRKKDIEQIHICLTFPTIPRDHPHKYALTVANTIFGGGMSSRLFQNIREDKGLVYSIYSYITAYSDTGLASIYAGMNAAQTEEVIQLIFQELEAIRNEKLEKALIDKTKEQIASNFIMGLENTNGRMLSNGTSMILRGRIPSQEEMLDKIYSVTEEDVHESLVQYFNPEKRSFSIVGRGNLDQIVQKVKNFQ